MTFSKDAERKGWRDPFRMARKGALGISLSRQGEKTAWQEEMTGVDMDERTGGLQIQYPAPQVLGVIMEGRKER